MNDRKLLEALAATSDAICDLYDMECEKCPLDLPHFDTCISIVISNIHLDKESELKKETDHANPR